MAKKRALYLGLCALRMAFAASAREPRFVTFDAPGAGQASGQGTGCFVPITSRTVSCCFRLTD